MAFPSFPFLRLNEEVGSREKHHNTVSLVNFFYCNLLGHFRKRSLSSNLGGPSKRKHQAAVRQSEEKETGDPDPVSGRQAGRRKHSIRSRGAYYFSRSPGTSAADLSTVLAAHRTYSQSNRPSLSPLSRHFLASLVRFGGRRSSREREREKKKRPIKSLASEIRKTSTNQSPERFIYEKKKTSTATTTAEPELVL